MNSAPDVAEECGPGLDIRCCYCSVTERLTLRYHGLKPTRLLCPSLSPGVCSNSCPHLIWIRHTHLLSASIPRQVDRKSGVPEKEKGI